MPKPMNYTQINTFYAKLLYFMQNYYLLCKNHYILELARARAEEGEELRPEPLPRHALWEVGFRGYRGTSLIRNHPLP